MTARNYRFRVLVIVLLLAIVAAGESARVNASLAAIVVYEHGFAKAISYSQRNGNVIPLDETSNFTQDDQEVYAYLVAAFYAMNFTWQWHDPTGQLYSSHTYQVQCTSTPCTVTDSIWMGTGSSGRTKLGTWRVEVLADGNGLYSDFFSLNAVLHENNAWNIQILQSAPPRVHANLTVTIHPTNQSWSSYNLFMPYAVNVTAAEAITNNPLNVSAQRDRAQNTYYIVNFGKPRSDGFAFVLNFYVASGLHDLSGWYAGQFAFTWDEYPWERFSVNLVPETFTITLPKDAKFIDVVNTGVTPLDYDVRGVTTISFNTTFADSPVEWTLIYQDFTYRNTHTSIPTSIGELLLPQAIIPFLPMTYSDLNLWMAVMSVFILTASELAPPLNARSGYRFLIDRKRLRIAALIIIALFIVSTTYRFFPTLPH